MSTAAPYRCCFVLAGFALLGVGLACKVKSPSITETVPQPPAVEVAVDANVDAEEEAIAPEEPTPDTPMGQWLKGETASVRVLRFQRDGRAAKTRSKARAKAKTPVPAKAPEPGHEFALLEVEVENRGRTVLRLKPTFFRLHDDRGGEFAPSDAWAEDKLAEAFLLPLPSRQHATVVLHYEILRGSRIVRFSFVDGTTFLPTAIDDPAPTR